MKMKGVHSETRNRQRLISRVADFTEEDLIEEIRQGYGGKVAPGHDLDVY